MWNVLKPDKPVPTFDQDEVIVLRGVTHKLLLQIWKKTVYIWCHIYTTIDLTMKDEIILYRPDELAEHIEVRIDEKTETIWLTQQQIADLFGTQRPAITKHLGNIFKTGELDEKVVYLGSAF